MCVKCIINSCEHTKMTTFQGEGEVLVAESADKFIPAQVRLQERTTHNMYPGGGFYRIGYVTPQTSFYTLFIYAPVPVVCAIRNKVSVWGFEPFLPSSQLCNVETEILALHARRQNYNVYSENRTFAVNGEKTPEFKLRAQLMSGIATSGAYLKSTSAWAKERRGQEFIPNGRELNEFETKSALGTPSPDTIARTIIPVPSPLPSDVIESEKNETVAHIVIKINGVWETEHHYGLSFKVLFCKPFTLL